MPARALISVIFIIFSAIFCSGHHSSVKTDTLVSVLSKRIPKLIERYDGAGISIALIEKGQISWSGGFGYADKNGEKRATAQTVYQAASISKPVTAWAIMKLVEEGLVDLDTPVSGYLSSWQLPESAFNNYRVTVRRILSHSAGLSLGGFPGFPPGYRLPALHDALSGSNSSKQGVYVKKEPGSEFDYSGGGYMLLSLIVEELTGNKFEAYMKEAVLIPLGMLSSTYCQGENIPGLAKPYNRDGRELPNYIYSGKGAAGLMTTVEDLAKLVSNLTENNGLVSGQQVLSKNSIKEMIKPHISTKGDIALFYDSMALGYFIDKTGMVSHTGSNRGWRSFFGIYPHTGDGIVILTNSDSGRNIYIDIVREWSKLCGYPEIRMVKFFKSVFLYSLLIALILLAASSCLFLRLIQQIRKNKRRFVTGSDLLRINFWILSLIKLLIPSLIGFLWVTKFSYFLSDLSPLTSKWLTLGIILVPAVLTVTIFFPRIKTPLYE
jgi:CubicO group peptidase (beta-lactamase class C family)